MPFVIIVVGLALIISAVRGSQSDLLALIEGDFTGDNNFVYWFLSLIIVGMVGYYNPLKRVSDLFMLSLIHISEPTRRS